MNNNYQEKPYVRVAVLVSGGGTNLQALIDAEREGALHSGRICLVISDRNDAYALERARIAGIESAIVVWKDCPDAHTFEQRLHQLLEENGIDLIVLAGFMRILSPAFTSAYPRRILNIHPSLIPAFCGKGYYGLKVHEAALARGVKLTGATVHYVNEIPDGGEIIMQKAVAVRRNDTPETLQQRVMRWRNGKYTPLLSSASACIFCRRPVGQTEQTKESKAMNVYEISPMSDVLKGNSYVGRGIVIGKTPDGTHAVTAYFIMGRSANSRNRVFVLHDGDLFTEPFDPARVEDPSLIIYAALRQFGNRLIVTNGDQTDTVRDGLAAGKSFSEALASRSFEPDRPNFTPRISGMVTFDYGDCTYEMSILKSADPEGTATSRFTFSYPALPGLGHFIHTYVCDGDPLPTFRGEPERVAIPDDIDTLTADIWNNLDTDNRISLYVRYTDIVSGEKQERIINRNA